MATSKLAVSNVNNTHHRKYAIIFLTLSVLFLAVAFIGTAYAAENVGSAASNIIQSISNLAKLITAGSYVAGFGFAVGAILKFKAHKDNPTQIPVGTPIALVFIGAALIFLPSIFAMTGKTIFGTKASVGGVAGVTKFK